MTAKPRRQRPKISQRTARALQRRVRQLEALDRTLRQAFGHAGEFIGSLTPHDITKAQLFTAARLGHVVVARISGDSLRLYAIPTETPPRA